MSTMNANLAAKVSCMVVLGLAAAGVSVSGCGKNETGVSKSESERLHAPLGQPMPPEAREAMAKMNRRPGAPAAGAPAAGAPAVPPGPAATK
jgi:hypothetical protein